MSIIKTIINFLTNRIWKVRLEDQPAWSAFLIKQLRIIIIVSRSFTQDKLQVQSAGLTYYTLLSVVPVVALGFAIAKGFGFQLALEEQLRTSLVGHEEVADQIMTFANRMLESTQGGILALVGIGVLLWTVVSLLANIETAFNDIWRVAAGRSWIRKFTEYFSIMLIAPVLVILSGSMQVIITSGFEILVSGVDVLQAIGPAVFFCIQLTPYILIWLVFTMVYVVMPNTKVNFKSALIAGMIAGTGFILLQWVYINFQVGVSRYNAIYGSFAALPLFMVWANMSWLITLLGAEIAYANQNVSEIQNELNHDRLSNEQSHIYAMMLCRRIASNYETGEKPLSAKQLSSQLKMPFGVTCDVLELLVKANVLTEIEDKKSDDNLFLPIRSFESITIVELFQEIDKVGSNEIPSMEGPAKQEFFARYATLQESFKKQGENIKIKDLPKLI